jgi:ethanolamine utilization protein EutN
MKLGRVVGTVVASTKVDGLEGIKLLIVQPLNKDLSPRGKAVVAADGVAMAGAGELVYVVESREAALAMPERFVPVDHAIVGIVDRVTQSAGND